MTSSSELFSAERLLAELDEVNSAKATANTWMTVWSFDTISLPTFWRLPRGLLRSSPSGLHQKWSTGACCSEVSCDAFQTSSTFTFLCYGGCGRQSRRGGAQWLLPCRAAARRAATSPWTGNGCSQVNRMDGFAATVSNCPRGGTRTRISASGECKYCFPLQFARPGGSGATTSGCSGGRRTWAKPRL